MHTIFTLISILATVMVGGFTATSTAVDNPWASTHAVHFTSHDDLGSSVAFGGTSSEGQASNHGDLGPSVDPTG